MLFRMDSPAVFYIGDTELIPDAWMFKGSQYPKNLSSLALCTRRGQDPLNFAAAIQGHAHRRLCQAFWRLPANHAATNEPSW